MKFGSQIRAIHFMETEIPRNRGMPDIAVAALQQPHANRFPVTLEDWTAWARWQATPGEHSSAFRDRITTELKTEGVSGELVYIYSRGGFWLRNLTGNLLPIASPTPATPAPSRDALSSDSVVRITGGLPGDGPTRAMVDDHQIDLDDDEPAERFEARVMAEAKVRGATAIIIGGLPDEAGEN